MQTVTVVLPVLVEKVRTGWLEEVVGEEVERPCMPALGRMGGQEWLGWGGRVYFPQLVLSLPT